MEVLPYIALFLSEEPTVPALKALITSHLLPIVVKVLNDPDQKVLKMAENALITMLEHCLVSGEYIEGKVWPVIEGRMKMCTDSSSLKATTIGVLTMMSKMAPWVGSEVARRLFVPLIVRQSKNPQFIIRRLCATIFGDICTVVGGDVTESCLLPSFLQLCRDDSIRVRQRCAESFMSVSCTVSLEIRKSVLAPAFASLLRDSKAQVELAAFQSLGPFITTFAQPSVTSLAYNNQGELVLKHHHGFEFNLPTTRGFCSPGMLSFMEADTENDVSEYDEEYQEEEVELHRFCFASRPIAAPSGVEMRKNSETHGFEVKAEATKDEEVIFEDVNYNQFNFWREPVVKVNLEDLAKLAIEGLEKEMEPLLNGSKGLKVYKDQMPDWILDAVHMSSQKLKTPISSARKQDIVPEELIKHFVSMGDRNHEKFSILNDLAQHCAYNLPAVALTLGSENWTLLKDTYETLAAHNQWRVRRIVASSIHELAVIVGEEVATQDLVPVFNGFIKDLDDVRIGALKHLANFLKLLRPAGRNSFLPRFAEFLITDYEWNWRFREELGGQLVQALGLFTPSDTCHFLTPVAVSLLLDKVAQVRKVALHLVTELVNHVSIDVGLLRGLLAELAAQFAHSNQWSRRQTFAFLCACLLSERVLSEEMFARDVLPHLLDLSWDRVPNVRLAVAKVLATHAMNNSYFADPMSPHHEVLMGALKRLQGDRDRDVRYFATPLNQQTTQTNEKASEQTEWIGGS